MVKSKIESNFLPIGDITFHAPLNYYVGTTDDYGRVNLTKTNAKKKFMIIEVKD